MPKAVWNEAILAESDDVITLEGNVYFPPGSINRQYFEQNDRHTTCPWKGLASYYDIEVDGKVNRDAVWYYPSPKKAAQHIKGYVAFWRGVQVHE